MHKSAGYFLQARSVGKLEPSTLHPPDPAAADHKPESQMRTASQMGTKEQKKIRENEIDEEKLLEFLPDEALQPAAQVSSFH